MSAPNRDLGPCPAVAEDWRGELPEAQRHAFEEYTKKLEGAYLIFSISLDEAISLHDSSWVGKSFQVTALTAELCVALATSMDSILRSLAEHCGEHGTNPTVAPLNPSNFSNTWARLMASRSVIWHNALPTRRAQFQSKIRTLRSMIRHARQDLCTVSKAFAIEGVLIDSSDSWAIMDRAHFDLNTCLRELYILLKCFLRVLPSVELSAFHRLLGLGAGPIPLK